jgi:orotate phosphoribosyltransferase
MDPRLDPALKIAEFLLQIKAVKLSPKKPFTWASGWKAPIYCDNRKTLSHPPIRTYIRQQFVTSSTASSAARHDRGRGHRRHCARGARWPTTWACPFLYVRAAARSTA